MIEKLSDILIITDIDGTLLREDKGISEENLNAIKRFTDKGGSFTVSTGRTIDATVDLIKDIPINTLSTHINGGYFFNLKNQEIVYPNYISDKAKIYCEKIVKKFENCDCHFAGDYAVNLMTKGNVLRKYLPKREFHFFNGEFKNIPEKIYKFVICCDPEYMNNVRDFAKSVCQNDVKVI